eukprot:5294874-Alexandrium_andersonii.AAC.1
MSASLVGSEMCIRDSQRAFARNKANAGGPDGWAPADLQATPRIAAHRLAQMLNAIERSEMQWPRAAHTALAAHVAKTDAYVHHLLGSPQMDQQMAQA